MNYAGRNKKDQLPWLVMFILWLTAFTFSIALTTGIFSMMNNENEPAFTRALFGASRKAISSYFYNNAELYFHRGRGPVRPLAFRGTLFQEWDDEIKPSRHSHRAGMDVKEIMPWLWLSIRMDPSNVETYLTASFWLAHECGRPDLAHMVLAEARWANSFNYKTALEDACLYLKDGNTGEAGKLFESALAFWPGTGEQDSDDARRDKARILLYRALIFESENSRDRAIEDLREILRMFPARKELLERIADLQKEKQPSRLASADWNDILKKDAAERSAHICTEETGDKTGNGHDSRTDRGK